MHRISTLIGPSATLGSGDSRQTLPTGFHLVRSEKSGYEFVTVGDAGTDTVSDLAQRVRAAQ